MDGFRQTHGSCLLSHGDNYISRYSVKMLPVGRKPRAVAETIKGRQLPSIPEGHYNPGNTFTKHFKCSYFQQWRSCSYTEIEMAQENK